ncbi:putative Ig domain-containing protein [Thalassotalea psychrophila]|uniref:Ig domain-containing protein n=1 Tax=Thalassotalea psychrophila TaxID=3065647 RepID=A0ABY9TXJ6_9GAMM|nr:putative Ig domain-containing protein [Colwelliaceae bacterium SQ149]
MNKNLNKSSLALLVAATLGLTACGGGGSGSGTPDPGNNNNTTNSAPVITGTADTYVDEGAAYSFTPTATDSDAGDTVTFTISEKPEWAAFDADTGTLSGTPAQGQAGIYENITISATDGTDSTALAPFTLTVNDIFSLIGQSSLTVVADDEVVFTPTLNDAEAANVTYSVSGAPSWAGFSFDTTTGSFTANPTAADVGTYTIVITASTTTTSQTHTVMLSVTPASVNIIGKVVDGYINGASVFLDLNNNFTLDEGEPVTVSADEGDFTLTVTGDLIEQIKRSTLVANIGEGADDISRRDDDFAAMPFKLYSFPVTDAVNEDGDYTAVISPFTHLVHQQILASVGNNLAAINDSIYADFKTEALKSVSTKYAVDNKWLTVDFFATDVPLSTKTDLAALAQVLVEREQANTNDTDNDGVVDANDDLPNNADFISDIDKDGLGDCATKADSVTSCTDEDGDSDNDGILNDADPKPYEAEGLAVFDVAAHANIPGYDMCLGLKTDNSLLCLKDYKWSKPTSLKGYSLNFTADAIIQSGDKAASVGTCVMVDDAGTKEIFCLDGQIKVWAGEQFLTNNPTHMVMGFYHMCYADESGINCFSAPDASVINDTPDLTNVQNLVATARASCALGDETIDTVTSTVVKCWGGDEYEITTVMPEFVNPQELFASETSVCVIDDNGLQCWGNPDYTHNSINHASTTISNLQMNNKRVCLIDDGTPICYGQSDQVNSLPSAPADIYDENNVLIVAEGDYVAPMEETLTPYIEGVHQNTVLLDAVTFAENAVANSIYIADKNVCTINEGQVSCSIVRSCGFSLNELEEHVWGCSDKTFELDLEFDARTLTSGPNGVCAIGSLDAQCTGTGFEGEVKP